MSDINFKKTDINNSKFINSNISYSIFDKSNKYKNDFISVYDENTPINY
ncbi:hypothetical protein [Spiroplasma litorale]